MPTKDKKKKSSSSKSKSSSSSSKKDSSKDKKKKSSSGGSSGGSKRRSKSPSRKSAAADEESQPVSNVAAPQSTLPPSSTLPEQQDPKASSDFEAGLLFQRFARNGGVDAKDFQRMWREREQTAPTTRAGENSRTSGETVAGVSRGESSGGLGRGSAGGGGGAIGHDKIFEFGQLFQKFDSDGDGKLGRADFERMIGGMLDTLGGDGGSGRGDKDTEPGTGGGGGEERRRGAVGINNDDLSPLPPPPSPPPPSPAGSRTTHYDETTGVPLPREAVASQKALGHTVVPLAEAYDRRLAQLQSLASSRLMPARERLLQLRRRLHGRGEEVHAAKAAIERETLADAGAIVERLRSAEALKQATLAQGIHSVTAELEVVEKLSGQIARVTALASPTPTARSPSTTQAPEVAGTDKMVELIQSYRELCNSIDLVADRPFDPNVDVQADDYPHETAERLEVLRRADRYEQALSVKDQMLWVAMQECQRLEAKCQEERSLGQEFAEEAQEWVKLTGKLSDRVNHLSEETEQMSILRKNNALLVRENEELSRRLETLERQRP